MASISPGWHVTERDLRVLEALDWAPLTAHQLKILSATWPTPFGSARLVRDRLLRLANASLVTSHPYVILQRGQPEKYYLLTIQGYHVIHGPKRRPPTKRYCSPVAIGRQAHQRANADFLVHTAVGAQRSRLQFVGYRRENTVRLEADGQSLFPDGTFVVRRGDAYFRYYVELDNSTERVQSSQEAESIERKLRIYDAYQDLTPLARFRVIFVSVRDSHERIKHILDAADRVIHDPNRTLFCASTLSQYLMSPFPLTSPVFLDRWGKQCPLVPDVRVCSNAAPRHLMTPSMA